MTAISSFFSEQEKKTIIAAIRQAENHTSGEIRVHIEKKCRGEAMHRAAQLLHSLKMDKTRQRNAVLFYLAITSRQFAIVGDKGINDVVPDDFWDNIKANMEEAFKNGQFAQGLTGGIQMAGRQLKKHFPWHEGDVNELSDEISFSDD